MPEGPEAGARSDRGPRHAAALRYEPGADAPRVVASGRGEVARRIVQAAQAAGVPVREQAALAEALGRLQLGSDVPPALYTAVAEPLVWAHRLDAVTATGRPRSPRDRSDPPSPVR